MSAGAAGNQAPRNKATAAKAAAIAASGLTPLDYMISVLRDEKRRTSRARMEAAKSAAPYVHPRLASIEHGGKDGSPVKVETIQIRLVRAKDEDVPT